MRYSIIFFSFLSVRMSKKRKSELVWCFQYRRACGWIFKKWASRLLFLQLCLLLQLHFALFRFLAQALLFILPKWEIQTISNIRCILRASKKEKKNWFASGGEGRKPSTSSQGSHQKNKMKCRKGASDTAYRLPLIFAIFCFVFYSFEEVSWRWLQFHPRKLC